MDTPEVTETPDNVTHLVRYSVTLDDIRAMGAKYAALTCETSEAYEETRKAIAVLRSTRVGIEERRKQLNAAALEHTRNVNATAKTLTAEGQESSSRRGEGTSELAIELLGAAAGTAESFGVDSVATVTRIVAQCGKPTELIPPKGS